MALNKRSMGQREYFRLADLAGEDLEVNGYIEIHHEHSILLAFDGYGDHASQEGYGHPVCIEVYQGKLRILVWDDINQEDPTHIISLEGARESARIDTEE